MSREKETMMPIERIKPDAFPAADRIEALKELFPEAFADGAIDWATLRDLTSAVPSEDEEENAEHFGLFWPGKREARRLAGKPAEGTLIPCPSEGVDEDKTSNVFIEGENLEVLKLLRKSYKGMVKMIYIDPPYNTGNDFVYDDNFTEPLEDYLRRTAQIDGEGRPLTTNKKSDGRFHSKWLSMMYPRLRLARDLLRDDGVIFVSIDDNEVQHLRMLMNEVFGEENFVASFTRKVKIGGGSASNGAAVEHDFVIAFCRSKEFLPPLFIDHPEEYAKRYSEQDVAGRFFWDTMERSYTQTRPYIIIAPDGTKLRGNWFRSESRFNEDLKKGEVKFLKKQNGEWSVQFKQRMPEGKKLRSILYDNRYVSNPDELASLGLKNIFSFPKPITLLHDLIRSSTTESETVLDFFSGSATTAHAVLDLNKEDSGHRKFILVQMPEATPADSEAAKAGYKTIAEIGKERIRRVIKKIKAEKAQELSAEGEAPDLGFKVFKLARSNFKTWKDYRGDDIAAVESLFENAVTPLASGWKDNPDALFTEILLLEGYPLDSAVKERAEFGVNAIREVSCPQHEKRLLVCLDEAISPETVRALELRPDEIFVCLDSAIDDSTKARLDDKGMIKTI